MKKLYLYTIAICLLAMACQQPKEKHPQLPPDVESVAIIEINNAIPSYEIIDDSLAVDTNFVRINGVTEIDKNFGMKIIQRQFYNTKPQYQYGEGKVSDTIRKHILQIIKEFDRDSIYRDENRLRIYDGHMYSILLRKSDGQIINLAGIPHEISSLTKKISIFMRDSIHKQINTPITNRDSIKEYLRRYDNYASVFFELPPMPDLPIKKGYETPYY